ncbi:phage holin family protein [Pseudonocardia sp. ICBG1293]|uniref:phage holin family protein n=1 Tax=Pseudonocardia sp. ICBG1293 TaxID=2844382 RepID=UPI001CCD2F2D|nr:phage holin family protein [Pseudonocardia sp. ICBG1293]
MSRPGSPPPAETPGHRPPAPAPGPDRGSRPAPETAGADPSLGDLMGRVSRDLSTLVRQELSLAQAELRHEARRAGATAVGFGTAGYATSMVLLFLSVALWAGLSNVMDGGWAGLLVALVWAVVAAAAYAAGRSSLRRTHPTPTRTVDTLSRLPDALRGR